MKKADFKKGRRGFIVRMHGKTNLSDIRINEVQVEGIADGYPSVWDLANEESLFVELRDVFYSKEEARKHIVRFLSKQLKIFLKGAEQ